MRVAFLYNESCEDPAGQSDDGPDNSPIVAALERGGHAVTRIACTLDLLSVRRRLEPVNPEVVFNGVDSLGGSDARTFEVTRLLDEMRLAYTGCPTDALVATASKVAAKERMIGAGLPTPGWVTADSGSRLVPEPDRGRGRPGSQDIAAHNPQFILKSIYEHASFQMDDASVVGPTSVEHVAALVQRCEAETGRPYFAEEYVEGREFNLALWGNEPELLPPAEIEFSGFPDGKPRIVGHRAKWVVASFEYDQTIRRFEFPPADGPLLRRLGELAVDCWRLFGLRGYARVDFRVDAAGQPWILEVNCNPCLSPDAGFAAALERAGVGYDEGIQRILEYAVVAAGERRPLRPRDEHHSRLTV